MPTMSKHRRNSGARIAVGLSKRHYGPEQQGAPCRICKAPMVTFLAFEGHSTHPTCDPEFVELQGRSIGV